MKGTKPGGVEVLQRVRHSIENDLRFVRELRRPNDPGLAPQCLVIFDDLRDLSGSRFRALAAEISTDVGHQAAVLEGAHNLAN